GALRVQLERPGGASVFWVAWHAGARLALISRPDRRVDGVRIEVTGLATVAADCDSVAIVGGELVTRALQVGPLGGAPTGTLPVAQPAIHTARAPGPIAVD